jgi:hypothetical protein
MDMVMVMVMLAAAAIIVAVCGVFVRSWLGAQLAQVHRAGGAAAVARCCVSRVGGHVFICHSLH